ncbi:MAG: 2-isopropylmalate synthase [Lachnospiraceae bacterium]|jgi:2-isopropylmalate synthase|nr:2-isopropylmalate synthase [Lachnospiraceae bacterium]
MNHERYLRNPVVDFPERTWVNKELEKAPIWCSVDLRDGNQALIEPMVVSEKIEMFQLLLALGFTEIEIGFPAASQIEFDFIRQLIERKLVPAGVKLQVLTQCRAELIDRTFEAIAGLPEVIVHIYNSTSTLQRDVVFGKDEQGIIDIAVEGARLVKKRAAAFPGHIFLEYSPESFTGTERPFALDICTAVQEIWQPTVDNPLIVNLPATVETTMPNVFADRVEWMNSRFAKRETLILSVHPHNDRGTGVATAELALLAGAERIEGTLFGNGERTGNVDILTIAYNMFSQGIDPDLRIDNINEIIEIYERCCKLPVHPRHPYAGKLVFTAFSGSHQDAINKGTAAMRERQSEHWQIPYLPIDPADIGREYEPIVRINSQSGKGGVAYIMDTYFGFKLPKGMHKEFSQIIQEATEKQGEMSPDEIMESFRREYLEAKKPYRFRKIKEEDFSADANVKTEFYTKVYVTYTCNDEEAFFEAEGNGPIDAVNCGLQKITGVKTKIIDYEQHALQSGSDAQAVTYVPLMNVDTGAVKYGVGISSNITRASVRAVFSAVNRLLKEE